MIENMPLKRGEYMIKTDVLVMVREAIFDIAEGATVKTRLMELLEQIEEYEAPSPQSKLRGTEK